MKKIVFAFAVCLSMHAATIDFTADTTGSKPNGFSAVGHPDVTFTDTLGADLSVLDFGVQSIGNGLAVNGDDASRLRIDFASGITFLSISFGNDDAGFTTDGDRAWLEVYNGAILLDTVSVVMNRDDVMNQSITWTGAGANNALFWYGNSTGTPIGLIEIVDDIDYRSTAVVPEPSTFALMGLGVLALFARRR